MERTRAELEGKSRQLSDALVAKRGLEDLVARLEANVKQLEVDQVVACVRVSRQT
jgi:hypothetical protein